MAKFNANEVDNYGGNGNSGFFSLKDDKDTATVRFMYNTAEDISGYAVHEVEVAGRKRYVSCLRAYNEPIDNCPLCAERMAVKAKFFIPLYDEESGEIKVWDRGKNFLSKLTSLCGRYSPLVATPFEIERNGKKGDQHTTYETYALQTDDTTLEDLPEVPEPLGTIILDKDYEELEYFLDHGNFPEEDEQEEPQPRRRTSETRSTGTRSTARSSMSTRSTARGSRNGDKF